MNRPIRTLAVFSLVLFGLLLANANYVQVFRAGALDDMAGNKRARDAECSRERGPILVGTKTAAKSLASNDRLKYLRQYTAAKLYAPVTGFFSCYYGTRAVENSENSILAGTDSRLFVNRLLDLVGNNRPQGGSVLTTISAAAQKAAYRGLLSLPGETRGAVVALDPQTGAILTDVSVPSYNPNLLATHDFDEATKAYAALNADGAPTFISRSTQSIYPPGSTFKLVTAATALSNGYTPDTMVRGGTTLDLPQSSHDLTNENGSDCGGDQITLTQALVVSCNVSFGDLGLKLGGDKLREQAEKFGFNEDFLDQLPASDSRFPDSLDEPQTALSAIGQFDVAASPLQMAMVAAGIANGGAVMTPYVVEEVRSPDLDVLTEAQPEVLHQAISGTVADDLTQMMVDVVNGGTGQPAQIPGVSVAGKTGTANSSTSRSPYAWMVAFAPANDPQVAVAVLIEQTDVPREDITGGGLAGPIARDVMEAVIQR
ncbi:MAG: penicillin-binding protein 2 [Nocardioidaceae bacterium]